MLQEMFLEYTPVKGAEVLFPSAENTVGNCPRCGQRVTESPKGFFCSNRDCRFAIWKNNRFFSQKKGNYAPNRSFVSGKGGSSFARLLFGENREILRCQGGDGG